MALGLDVMAAAIAPDTGTVRVGARLAYALAASELVTLLDAGRIDVRDGVVVAVAEESVDDIRAADALERLLRLPKPSNVYDWLRRRGPYRIEAYIAGLEDGALIRLTAMVGGGKRISVVNGGELRAVHQRLAAAYQFPPVQPIEDFAFAVLAVASRGPGFGFGSPSRERRRLVKRQLSDIAPGSPDVRVKALLRECLAAIDGLARSGGAGKSDDERMGLSEAGRWGAIASLFPNA